MAVDHSSGKTTRTQGTSTESAQYQAAAGYLRSPSSSRSLLVELVGNMVVFIISTLVCLQVFAASESITIRSRAVAAIGQDCMNIIEEWKAGTGFVDLMEYHTGHLEQDYTVLVFYYDSTCQHVEDAEKATYTATLTTVEQLGGLTRVELVVSNDDDVLLEWSVARFIQNNDSLQGD